MWVISRREDVERCIVDAATSSSTSISGSLDVPEAFLERVPPALMAKSSAGERGMSREQRQTLPVRWDEG